MMWIMAFAWLAAIGAAGAAMLAGLHWLDAAKEQKSWTEAARHAARATGYAFILGSLAFFVILADKIPTGT